MQISLKSPFPTRGKKTKPQSGAETVLITGGEHDRVYTKKHTRILLHTVTALGWQWGGGGGGEGCLGPTAWKSLERAENRFTHPDIRKYSERNTLSLTAIAAPREHPCGCFYEGGNEGRGGGGGVSGFTKVKRKCGKSVSDEERFAFV